MQSNQRLQKLNRRSNAFSILRLSVLIAGGILMFQVVQTEDVTLTLLSFLGTVLLFLLLVRFQSKLASQKKEEENYLKVNQNELAVELDLKANIYDNGHSFHNDQHLYTSDLDIFGEGSVFQLVNRCATSQGNQVLAGWFSKASSKSEIEKRQRFVEELVTDFSWWQDLQAKLYSVKKLSVDAKKLISHYLVHEIEFPEWKILKIYISLVPLISLVFLCLSFFQPAVIPFFTFFVLANLLLSIGFGKQVSSISAGLNKGGSVLAAYVPSIKKVEERPWESIQAKDLQKDIEQVAGVPVSQTIERLSVLLNRLDARLNMVMGIFLNLFLLWDLRQVYALKKWQAEQSKGILEALEMLSIVEAIGSLAALKFNHEDWVFPEIVDNFPTLELHHVRHPLIPENSSIPNEYHLQAHQIALITGSNMAGKSTFLRTIGVNAVLAFAGSAVCAHGMKVSVMQMASYMRIRDSLNESTSTFKAELNRIQQIVELVKNKDRAFVLLDEMLRGTNSMDKYLGSKAIIEKLIQENGVGMVATHDLKLSELSEQYPLIVKNFHFDIQIKGEEMHFDYQLKEGPCATFNASLLLKKIGIEI